MNMLKVKKEKVSSAFIAKYIDGITLLKNKIDLPDSVEAMDQSKIE